MNKVNRSLGCENGVQVILRLRRFVLLLITMSTAALASQVAAQTGCTIRGAQPQRIIVAPNQASPAEGQEIIARLAEAMGVQSVEKMVYGDAQIWTLSPDQDADRMAKLLNMYSFVRYAEVDSYRSPQSAPNKDRDCDVE